MKKAVLLYAVLFSIAFKVFAQPQIINPTFPSSVGLFDLFEVSFSTGVSYINPYDPDVINIYAIFIAPDNTTCKVEAFYYEGYNFYLQDGYEHAVADSSTNNGVSWRIRFTPTQTGTWRYRIVAIDPNGTAIMPNSGIRNYSFECTAVDNADGFISKANSRYLKKDVVRNGQRKFHSFFPIGPNVSWHECLDYGYFTQPRGIYFYEEYIDSLYNNANYMRVFINRFQFLSLFGPEYTQQENGAPKMYFNTTVNQKDSAELDYIITYALQHDINIMVSVFTCEAFRDKNHELGSPSIWGNNPFHTILGLTNSCDFFTDLDAKKITKNLIRYIVSRWGYATNVMNWELWNEVDHMFYMCNGYKHIEQDVLEWHDEMTDYIRQIDPFKHCVSTSLGSVDRYQYLYSCIFNNLDFVQQHNYQYIQNAESRHQISYILYSKTNEAHVGYPSKPFFMGEFGFDQSVPPYYAAKDPFGIDLHNSLWSTLFSSSIGSASFWWWPYLNSKGLFKRYSPLLKFCENIPILSETFTADQTGSRVGHELVFPNSLETYYMINATQDTILGWAQDTAFAYQSLRWLTDDAQYVPTIWGPVLRFSQVLDPLGYVYTLNPRKKPLPSSSSNVITLRITNQPVGSRYWVRWYNSETGLLLNTEVMTYATVQQDPDGSKYVSFNFPSMIRDLQQHTINNKFGDAVFILVLNNLPSENEFPEKNPFQ